MSPEEWWHLYECKRRRDPESDFAGRLTEDACAELYDMIH